MFVLNGLAYSNVVPRLASIKDELDLSNTALGTAVAAMPVGALLAGPLGGWLIARWGSARLVVACAIVLGATVPLFAFAPMWAALAGAFLLLGAADSLMDVSMNAQAVWVQRDLGRSIINSMHGLWSVGAVTGGLLGTAAAAAGLSLGIHLVVTAAFVVGAAVTLRRWLLPGLDPMRSHEDGSTAAAHPPATRRASRLLALGLLVVMAAVVEDTPASWGAVLMRTELGTSAAAAGLVYVAFQALMTVGRLVGDRVVDRFGPATVLRVGGALITLGMVGGLAIGSPVAVVAGFGVAGLGASPLFPLVFDAAARVPGVDSGHGLAAIAWMGRVGFLVSPPFVGLLADAFTLRGGLFVAPAAGVVVFACAGFVATPRRAPSTVTSGA